MIYLLFRYSLADTRKVYEEFKSKEDVVEFIKEKRDKIEIDKIFEPGREFKIDWILILEEIEKPKKRVATAKELQPQTEAKRKRGRPKKKGKSSPEFRGLLEKGVNKLDQEEPGKEEIESVEEPAEAPEESSEVDAEEEGNDIKDEQKEEGWQLEISIDSQGRKKRKCWNPNCRKWFVIKDKGQRYHHDTCRHQHQQRGEAE